jgi:hypothetical protein
MSVTQRNMPSGDTEGYTFFDIDGTYTFEDTGHLSFLKVGKTSEEFEKAMKQTHVPGKGEPEEGQGNELVLTLHQMDAEEVDQMAEGANQIEVNYRPGIDSLLKGLDERGSPAIAHSAGWEVPIKAVTNGYFDEKIAAELGEEEPTLNGRYQKPVRIQNYLLDQGIEDPIDNSKIHTNFIGDSNTDSEAIRYADATGGLGAVIEDSLGEAMDVEDATVYFGDGTGEHDLAAAVIYYHNTGDIQETSDFVDDYDLDVLEGEAQPGELAYRDERHEYIQNLIDEVRRLE